MPRRRSAESMEKDAQAYDLYRRGLSYRQIAAQVGWKSPKSALEAVKRAAADNVTPPGEADAARQVFYDRLQDYRRAMQRVLATRHYVTSQSGKLVLGPDGQPLLDDDPVGRAVDRLLKIDDTEIRLRGLYAPVRARVEVIPDDVLDDEIRKLNERLAATDEAMPGAEHPG